VLTIQKYHGLMALPQAYQAVFEEASKRSVFLSFPWFRNFEENILARSEESLIYGVEGGEVHPKPLAALVLHCSHQHRGILRPSIMEGLSNYYTTYFGPAMADDTMAGKAVRSLTNALWRDRQYWDVINLRPLDRESSAFKYFVQSFRELGVPVQTYFCFGNWYLDVRGRNHAEYFKSLPSVLRKNIPYETRKLERRGSVRFKLIIGMDGLEKSLDDFEKVYNSSWRIPEPYPNFIRGLARAAALQGWLRLGVLYLDDEPAAAQLWLVHARVASIYKICYQERFGSLSVGKILTNRLIQHAIDVDKVSVVDYLSGDDAYKKDWMSHRRELWGLMAFNPNNLRGLSVAIRHIGGRYVKRSLKSLRDRMRLVGTP
jgi:CelD/BcsL family acetyltransferase involved in cellulose biosynthesis